MGVIGLFAFSYLVGSVPFGLVIAYLVKRIDIRQFGSGNIGATNVVRVVGKKWGILVFALDFFKGVFAPLLTKFFLSDPPNIIYILAALFSISGHIWPVFLKFKGGKGVATSLGALCGLSVIFPKLWIVVFLSSAVWFVFFFIFRYVSLASILLSISFVIFSFIFSLPKEIKYFSFLLCLFIIFRHAKNIKNLLARKEHRF
jgi:glycerol-3-phosphate acyltransferase PlsY